MATLDKFEWAHEKCKELVRLLKNYPCVWCNADVNYKKKVVRYNAIQSIASVLDIPYAEVEAKIKNIISQYQRELRKTGTVKNGSAGEIYSSKWYLFKELKYMEDSITTRISTSSPIEDISIVQMSDGCDIICENTEDDVEEEHRQLLNNVRCDISTTSSTETHKKRKQENSTLSKAVTSLAKSLSDYTNKEQGFDKWEAFGKVVAATLRNFKTPILQIQAEREINTILFNKQVEDAGYTVITTEYPVSFMSKKDNNTSS